LTAAYAGIYQPHALHGDDLDMWNQILAVNTTGLVSIVTRPPPL
jgi:hypothetical protein